MNIFSVFIFHLDLVVSYLQLFSLYNRFSLLFRNEISTKFFKYNISTKIIQTTFTDISDKTRGSIFFISIQSELRNIVLMATIYVYKTNQ